jgi:hypothetical protein
LEEGEPGSEVTRRHFRGGGERWWRGNLGGDRVGEEEERWRRLRVEEEEEKVEAMRSGGLEGNHHDTVIRPRDEPLRPKY